MNKRSSKDFKTDSLKEDYSPCYNCLVRACCSALCDTFLTYYMCLKSLVEIKLEKGGVNIRSNDGNLLYVKIMVEILDGVKNEHKKTIEYVEQVLHNFNINRTN
jgi:hypothetical protein